MAPGVVSRPTDRGVDEVLARECGAAAFICKGNDLKASFASSGPEVLISIGGKGLSVLCMRLGAWGPPSKHTPTLASSFFQMGWWGGF